LATSATIASGAYARAVAAMSTRCEVFGQAAPLLVPLAEEGWTEGEVPRLAVRRYLEPLARANVDAIVLGCTHYPLLRGIIEHEVRDMMGPDIAVVDSGSAVAEDVEAFLRSRDLARSAGSNRGSLELAVTDLPRSFVEIARRFLGGEIGEVAQVDL